MSDWNNEALDGLLEEMIARVRNGLVEGETNETALCVAECIGYWAYRLKGCNCALDNKPLARATRRGQKRSRDGQLIQDKAGQPTAPVVSAASKHKAGPG